MISNILDGIEVWLNTPYAPEFIGIVRKVIYIESINEHRGLRLEIEHINIDSHHKRISTSLAKGR